MKTIPTWTCSECAYLQDYDPTEKNHAIHFPELGIGDNDCPSCMKNTMRIEKDLKKKITINKL